MRIRWNTRKQAWQVMQGMSVVASFDKLHQAECWVIAESERRESEAAS